MEKENQQDVTGLAITDFIRRRSEAGQFVTAEEIHGEFLRMGVVTDHKNKRAELEALLRETVNQSEELKEIPDGKGIAHYYSDRTMAETYARILIQREGDPLLLMAEVIRENSRRYPRPVPVNIFEESPFDLTPEQILACLKKMADEKGYQDIQQTATSIGTVFLYSSQHLEPDHASMLAEWLDVGQSNNP